MVRDKKNRLLQLSTEEAEQRRQHHLFARNVIEWLSIREFETTKECIQALREDRYQIYVTDLSQKKGELTPDTLHDNDCWPLPPKMAILSLPPKRKDARRKCRTLPIFACVYLPLRDFADSLNLSVAAALVIHHLLLLEAYPMWRAWKRRKGGSYEKCGFQSWLVSDYCRRKIKRLAKTDRLYIQI
mmetsp:Transcript_16608/g.31096  ORF Transcript_16608/g.31096 Transcript_16608/m.31096 type:complete len:186 (+) Transcript_16608:126-683(+)